MDANCLSPKELRELADKKEAENKVAKVGYLKCDLYNFNSDASWNGICFKKSTDFWLYTEKTKDKIIKEFIDRFSMVLPKGAKFVCFVIDGEDQWFDDVNYGVEGMDAKWAEKWLENIT